MYKKYWFVLPVHEVADKVSGEVNLPALINAKIIAMAILGLSALGCSVLPIAVTKYISRGKGLDQRGQTLLGILLRFGGGILLATTFIHLLPEVREGYEKLKGDSPKLSSWPGNLPELIMCVGFFMMYGIEEVAHKCLHKDHGHVAPEVECIDQCHSQKECSDRDDHALRQSTDPENQSYSSLNHITDHKDVSVPHLSPERSTNALERHHGQDNHNKEGHSHVVSSSGPPLRGLLIIIALSVHQIFEGLAVGLEDEASHVWMLLGAVAAHKLVIAFCVGFEIASARISFLAATACVAIFALASPIGIGIGIGLSAANNSSQGIDIASIILQGFATGTLLFVVFFEILTKSQDDDPKMGLIHFIAAVLGFIFMTVLLYTFTD